jgi:raffinose/stachyose/melibiose transport system substrate-binding protein
MDEAVHANRMSLGGRTMRTSRRNLVIGGSSLAATLALRGNVAPAAAQEKTKVTWWHISINDPGLSAWQALADAYMAEHPDVEIEITVLENEAFKQKLATSMQSGEPPDIFQSWGGGVLYEYAAAGLVKDITADLAIDGWGDSFLPAALALYGKDGQTWGVPWSMGMVVWWYNKALFAQAGIEATPTTWTELLDTVSKLKAAGITPITIGEGDKWPGHFYWVYLAIRSGGKAAFDAAYSREGSFADPAFVQAGTLLKQLVDLEPFQEGHLGMAYNPAETLLANGQAAMELMGLWSPSNQRSLSESGEGIGDDLGFFLFPSVDGGAGDPSDVLGGGDGFGIGKNASPAAIDFVRFLTSLENQTNLASEGVAVPPTVKGAEAGVTDPNVQEATKKVGEAKYLQLYYDQFLPPAVGAAVNDATQGLFAGTSSPEEVAQQIEEVASQEMDS